MDIASSMATKDYWKRMEGKWPKKGDMSANHRPFPPVGIRKGRRGLDTPCNVLKCRMEKGVPWDGAKRHGEHLSNHYKPYSIR